MQANLCEWWRIPFPSGEPELIAWTRMRTSAIKAIRHGVIAATEWPDFFYEYLKSMADDPIEPTKGPQLDLDLGACLFAKAPGPQARCASLPSRVSARRRKTRTS